MKLNQRRWLEPKKDTRKSFYRKAEVITTSNGEKVLLSYKTKVYKINTHNSFILNNNVKRELLFSQTTLRHIKEFLYQELNIEGITKKDLEMTLGRVW